MNRQCYRVVFNESRSLPVVVAELASAQLGSGRAGAEHSSVPARPPRWWLKPTTVALFLAFSAACFAPSAIAQIVADPNSPANQRPTVLNAGNGVPQVDIQTPSAAGVSRNSYSQFDVQQQGAILNNSRTATQTQQGGWIQGNPWLAKGTARVILNEVNSSAASQLRGYIEVAGNRAQVVIANPAGITCDGCGFINANRATLTTGTPIVNGGNLDGYRVQRGNVLIEGNGLDASRTDFTDIIARAVQVNAGVWANALRVTAGANEVGADHERIAPIAGAGGAPAFAVDVAQLGGMYANSIRLIGTEAGLGVRSAGQLGSSAGDIVVLANGLLENASRAAAAGDLRIDAEGGIRNDGILYALGNAAVGTRGDVVNSGTIAALGNASIAATGPASRIESAASSILAAGMASDGQIVRGAALELSATVDAQVNGQVRSGQSLRAAAGTVSVEDARIDAPEISITAGAGAVQASRATITAGGTLAIEAAGTLRTDDASLSAAQLQLRMAELSNRRGQIVQTGSGVTVIAPNGALDNTSGRIASNGADLTIAAGALSNTAGRIQHAGTGTLSVSAGSLTGINGQIVGNGAVSLSVAGAADVSGGQTAGERLTVNAGSLNNAGGRLVQRGGQAAAITVAGLLDNSAGGVIASNGATAISAGGVDNRGGAIQAAQLTGAASGSNLSIGSTGLLDNRAVNGVGGQIAASGAAQLTVGSLNNTGGQISAVGSLGATVANALTNDGGAIAANGAVTLGVGGLSNTDGTVASIDSGVGVGATGAVANTRGRIVAGGGAATVSAGSLSNAQGRIGGAGLAVDTGTGALNNDEGQLFSSQSATVASGVLSNNHGLIQAAGSLVIDTRDRSLTNTNSGADRGITSGGVLTLAVGNLNNTTGFIGAGGAIGINGNALHNGGQIGSQGSVALAGTSFDNGGGQVQAVGDLSVNVGGGSVGNSGALLRSGQSLSVTAGSVDNRNTAASNQGLEGRSVGISAGTLDNRNGAIRADQGATLAIGSSLDNSQGTISAGQALQVVASGASIANTGGTLIGGSDLAIWAGSFNGAGRVLSLGNLALTLPGGYSHTGAAELQANGNMTLSFGGNLDNSATLRAGGGLTINAANVNNAAGAEISSASTAVAAAGTLNNRGLIDGSATLVSAGTLNNTGGGRIYGDHLAVAAGTLNNTPENGTAPVIAARSRLDIGAANITNQENALIFSAGDLAIGGSLDGARHATGRAGTIENKSATIEALGTVVIGANSLSNINEHFAIASRQVSSGTFTEYQPGGSAARYDSSVIVWGTTRRGASKIVSPVDVEDYYVYNITRSVSVDELVESKPARIASAASMTLDVGSGVNTNSQIVSGGGFYVVGRSLSNVETKGLRTSTESGSVYWSHVESCGRFGRRHCRRDDAAAPYTPQPLIQEVDFGIARYGTDAFQRTANGATGRVGSAVNGNTTAPGAASATSRYGTITEVVSRVGRGSAANGVAAGGAIGGSADSSIESSPGQSGGAAGPNKVGAALAAAASAVKARDAVGAGPGAASAAAAPQAATGDAVIVVRTTPPNVQVPNNALYRVASAPASQVVVETDPQFASYKTWLSSDYLIKRLDTDAAFQQKRLGDGFYEQRLVQEQVLQLTGRRFLAGYYNDQEQYQALMDNAASLASAYNLIPGVSLSAEQMAQLTSDIVWLVSKEVQLPDGRTVQALVPQVYVRVRQGDLDGSGALISADVVNLNLSGDLVNRGTIAGRSVVSLTAENLQNLGGRITGQEVAAQARTDLANLGGIIEANRSLSVAAGRDLTVSSETISSVGAQGSRTNVSRVAGLYVNDPGGILVASAGRDLTLVAAQVVNTGQGSVTALVAGRDLKLGTVTESFNNSVTWDAKNYLKEGSRTEVGSTVQAVGDVQLKAGRDLTARAATVTSSGGAVVGTAGRDTMIEAGTAQTVLEQARVTTSRGFLSSKSTTTRDSLDRTDGVGSLFSGVTTVLSAGNDLTVRGSAVVSDNLTALFATNNLSIEALTVNSSETHFRQQTRSGLVGTGGIGFTIGTRQQSVDGRSTSSRAIGSTVGSIGGDVVLQAGNAYRQVGSAVSAPQGSVDIAGKGVQIVEAREASQSQTKTEFRQSGLTVALSSPVLTAIQTGIAMKDAASQTGDTRMKALAAANTGLAAKDAVDAVKAGQAKADATAADKAGGINLSISVGASKSSSVTDTKSDSARGSSISAGQDIRIRASGAGEQSNLLIQGSDIKAGNDIALSADNRIDLLAARNTASQQSSNKSASGSVGVNVGTAGVGVTVSASVGRGKADGQDETWSNSHVQAGNNLTITSGGDTTLRGAVASGNRVTADVGGNLTIESLQDKSTYSSKQQSASASVTVGAGAGGSASASQSKANSNFASVTEQSGIRAEDGGFAVDVKGDTTLKGGAITSTEAAVQSGANRFATGGALNLSDIQNKAEYSASSVSVGVGTGFSAQGKLVPQGTSAGLGRDSGSASSTTQAAISGIAGNTAARTGDAETGIKPIFDAQKVLADVNAQARIRVYHGSAAYLIVDDGCGRRETIHAAAGGFSYFVPNKTLGMPTPPDMPSFSFHEYALPAGATVTVSCCGRCRTQAASGAAAAPSN